MGETGFSSHGGRGLLVALLRGHARAASVEGRYYAQKKVENLFMDKRERHGLCADQMA